MKEFTLDKARRIVTVDPPAKPKKITGTRLAAILGANHWSTPFEAWCQITRTYEKPFEGTIYTEAGKVIEPIIDDYLRKRFFMDDLKTPEDVFGKDFFKKTWGDFYAEDRVFGGMWDAIGDDYIVEIKTTKRVEDWKDEPPYNYMLQGALYAWLKGFDRVILVCALLEEDDYEHPEKFVPDSSNVIFYEMTLSERFPNFEDEIILPALAFWRDHVETGVSPEWDEKKDADILKALQTNTLSGGSQKAVKAAESASEESLDELIAEYELVCEDVLRLKARYGIDKLEERAKELPDLIKGKMIAAFRDTDKKVEYRSASTIYTVTKKAGSDKFDAKRFKADKPDLYLQYMTPGKPSFALTTSEIKKEEQVS